jgi:hypothetical protein
MMNPMGAMMNPMSMSPMPMMGGTMMPALMMQMAMMMPMACRISCEMNKDSMTIRMTPMDAAQLDALRERCNALNAMMGMGMPALVTCGGMPLVMGSMMGPGTH